MTGIDFEKIRSDSDTGQRGCFEKFVCELASRDQPKTENCEFRDVEGSGGDGGVEAYWLCADGTKIGYQAKYWLKARDIKWRQVDKSVRKAIQTHPELTRYVVAIPCKLTDQTGTKPKRTGWQQWAEHKKQWESEAAEAGIKNLKFDFWCDSKLRGRASDHLSSGAIAYWFDVTILDADWFKWHSEKVKDELGDRFMPESNVDTDITKHFAVFLKEDQAFDYLENAITKFMGKWPQHLLNLKSSYPTDNMHAKIDELAENISQLGGLFSKELLRKKGWESIKRELDKIIEQGTVDARDLWKEIPYESDKASDNALKDAKPDLQQITNHLDRLYEIVQSPHFLAHDKLVFLLNGAFGTGKSHALGRLLETEVKDETPMVLFLGQQFFKGNPEQQMVDKIGIASLKTFSQFLEALNARAEACGKIGIVAIDAINEGAGLDIWPNFLAGFLKEISNFPFLKAIVSCRSEFTDIIVREKVQKTAYNYDLRGFSSDDELERALQRFMDKQGIERPLSLIFLPAFRNPLFLSVACRALKDRGKKRFPDGLTGIVELIRFYLGSIGNNIRRHYYDHFSSNNPKEDIIRGIYALAEKMAEKKQLNILREQATQILRDKIQTPAPKNMDWLSVLLGTGCLRDDPGLYDPSSITKNIVVSFAYQSFGDYLIADALYKSLQGDFDKIFESDGALSFMIGDDFLGTRNDLVDDDEIDADDTSKVDNYRINTHWRGVFMMLWVIFAEKQEIELHKLLPSTVLEYDEDTINKAFVDGLFWRSPSSITEKTTEYRDAISKPHWLVSEHFWLASHLLAIPNHPWDAFALSEELKQYASMAERDAEWTMFLSTNYEIRTPVNRLIEWSLVQKDAPTKEVAIRIMIALSWCLSSSHRKLRDRATRALVNMLRLRPELMPELFKEFAEVNDLYIMERLLAALYGACQFIGAETDDKRCVGEVAQCVYDTIFADETPPLHLLVRDYAQGIIERADYLNILPKGVDLDKCTPPYKSHYPQEFQNNDPGTIYTNEAIDDLAKSVGDEYKKIAKSCTTEYGRGMSAYGDFGRYVLQYKVDSFCAIPISQPLPEKVNYDNKFNGKLVGNWVARRVYEHYGWTEKLFPSEPNSRGRDRSIIERIGKKYQWIAMYELLGVLSDHVYARGKWRDEKKIYTSIEDLSDVRDIDPTISIGINRHEIPELPHLETSEPLPKESDEISKIRGWLFDKKVVITDLKNKIKNAQAKGRRWYMLHSFYYKNIASIKSEQIILNEFFLLSAHCLPVADMKKFLKENRKECLSDFFEPTRREPRELFEGKFLLEMDWRNLPAPSKNDYNETQRGIPHYHPIHEYAFPKSDYETGHNGSFLPHPRIMSYFGLKIDSEHPNLVRDQENNIVFYTHSKQNEDDSQQVCYINADLFDEFLNENDLVCVWLLGGERMWMIVNTLNDCRYFSSMAWMENNQMQVEHWHEDIQNKG